MRRPNVSVTAIIILEERYFIMAVDNKKIAQEVLAAVGGKDNITSATHCMTRLRDRKSVV